MTCDKSMALMSAYVDGYISDDELIELNEHLDSCEACTIEFEELKLLKEVLGEIDMKPLPKHFEAKLHDRLMQETGGKDQQKEGKVIQFVKKHKQLARWGGGAVAAVLVVAIATSQAPRLMNFNNITSDDTATEMATSSAPQDYGYADTDMAGAYESTEEAAYVVAADVAPEVNNFGANSKMASNTLTLTQNEGSSDYREERLIIHSANLQLDVEDFDVVVDLVKQSVGETDGYIENEQVSNKTNYRDRENLKSGSLVLRIPAYSYDYTLDTLKQLGNVTYFSADAEDVTKRYRDTANTIENLKITEARLREILESATEIDDILEVETELTRVRGNIDAYTRQLKDWEGLADLATVYVSINEVDSLKPIIEPIDNSIWTEAKEGLVETINTIVNALRSFVVWVVANSPIFAIMLIVGLIIRTIYFKTKGKGIKKGGTHEK